MDNSERRGLEYTGIVLWDDRHTEHMARRAAEIGDRDTESLCDDVMAGMTDPEFLVDVIERDDGYHRWMRRGSDWGLERRAPI